jgi:hypothetical protein
MTRSTLTQAVKTTINSILSEMHTCLPGRIEKYDYSNQKATVKPLIKKVYLNDDVLEIPVLVNVPIVFPRSKTSGITFPLNKGDGVLIVFSERSLERWYSSGEDSEPGDPRKFDLSDAIAIPGLFSFAQSNIAHNNDDVEIQNRNGSVALGSDTSNTQKLIDGVLTGKTLDQVTGLPYNSVTTNMSQKVRAEF